MFKCHSEPIQQWKSSETLPGIDVELSRKSTLKGYAQRQGRQKRALARSITYDMASVLQKRFPPLFCVGAIHEAGVAQPAPQSLPCGPR
jgi:hypothetical protein